MPMSFDWVVTMGEIARDEPMTFQNIAYGLRCNEPVPREVREFLADLLEGKVKRPVGKPSRDWFERESTGNYIRTTYELMREQATNSPQPGKGETPSEVAFLMTKARLAAEGLNVSEDVVRDAVKRRRSWKD